GERPERSLPRDLRGYLRGRRAAAAPRGLRAARGQLPVAGWPCSERGEADPRDAAGSAQE
ncbi:unnamed protein product, partial [Effrenium voratum]